MKTNIPNFTGADQVTIQSSVHRTCGPLVTLLQRAGSSSFQFDMTPAQALEMSTVLLLAVEEMATDNDQGDDTGGICPACSGSGEGMHEGTTCRTCRGKGEA